MPTNPSITSYRSRSLRGLRALSAAGLLMLAGQARLRLHRCRQELPHADPAPRTIRSRRRRLTRPSGRSRAFKKPADLQCTVWAAEPQLINPVRSASTTTAASGSARPTASAAAACWTSASSTDWVEEDLACRTVDDRVAMIKRHWPDLAGADEKPRRIRLLEDTSGKRQVR